MSYSDYINFRHQKINTKYWFLTLNEIENTFKINYSEYNIKQKFQIYFQPQQK